MGTPVCESEGAYVTCCFFDGLEYVIHVAISVATGVLGHLKNPRGEPEKALEESVWSCFSSLFNVYEIYSCSPYQLVQPRNILQFKGFPDIQLFICQFKQIIAHFKALTGGRKVAVYVQSHESLRVCR
jgi:hypothetical protein